MFDNYIRTETVGHKIERIASDVIATVLYVILAIGGIAWTVFKWYAIVKVIFG